MQASKRGAGVVCRSAGCGAPATQPLRDAVDVSPCGQPEHLVLPACLAKVVPEHLVQPPLPTAALNVPGLQAAQEPTCLVYPLAHSAS